MKHSLTVWLILLSASLFAQTAMDFNRTDCNGNPQHLFADLDSGKVVILEFFMTSCSPCVVAGSKLEEMRNRLEVLYPGKVKAYSIGYTNAYSCATVSAWVSGNGFSSVPMDSGAAQVAHYGGFGMPTVVMLAGTDHRVMHTALSFTNTDTTIMADSAIAYLSSGSTGIGNHETADVVVFPNPAQNFLRVNTNGFSDEQIEIVSIDGRILIQSMLTNGKTSIDLGALSSGFYFVRIRSTLKTIAHPFIISR